MRTTYIDDGSIEGHPTASASDLEAVVSPHRRIDSRLHGPEHWRRVARFGAQLAERVGLDDRLRRVVRIFSWTHDLAREDDDADPEHGARGARLFGALANSLFPDLDDAERELIAGAIRLHNSGMTADEAIMTGRLTIPGHDDERAVTCVGTCWDADRLDLLRLGIMPHPDRMSTEAWEDVLPIALDAHGWR